MSSLRLLAAPHELISPAEDFWSPLPFCIKNSYADQDPATKSSPRHLKPTGLLVVCLLQPSPGWSEQISAVPLIGTRCLYGNERQESPEKDAAERTVSGARRRQQNVQKPRGKCSLQA